MDISYLQYDLQKLASNYFRYPQPIIIKNLLPEFGEINAWSLDLFAEKLQHKTVECCYSLDGWFGADPARQAAKNRDQTLKMPFTQFLNCLHASDSQNGFYYLQLGCLFNEFQELKSQWKLPDCIPENQVHALNLWIGPKDGLTVLHYDRSNNFLLQVKGVKKVVLYHPWDCFNLYPYPWQNDAHHTSRILNIEAPETQQFPRFNRAKPLVALLKPGEVLYIPPFWWHQVFSLDISISVNIWWHAQFRQKLVPAYPRYLMRAALRKLRKFGW